MKLLFAAMSLVCALGFSRLQVSTAAEETVASAPVLTEETSRPSEDVEIPEELATCSAFYICWATGRFYSNPTICWQDCAPAGCLVDHNCNGTCICP